MRRAPIIISLVVFAMSPKTNAAPIIPDDEVCSYYAKEAENAIGIPHGLMMAVSTVESGLNGKPWPWTLNIDGKAYYFKTKEEAVHKMVGKDGKMHSQMAVGCSQIFVAYHGENFAGPEQMIDPRSNIYYAAEFMKSLHSSTGTWTAGTARYHSSRDHYQRTYVCKVLHQKIRLGYSVLTPQMYQYCAGPYLASLAPDKLPSPTTPTDWAVSQKPVARELSLSPKPTFTVEPPSRRKPKTPSAVSANEGIARALRIERTSRPSLIGQTYRLTPMSP